MSANPHANGGLLMRPLRMPDYTDYAVKVPAPAQSTGKARALWAPSCATS